MENLQIIKVRYTTDEIYSFLNTYCDSPSFNINTYIDLFDTIKNRLVNSNKDPKSQLENFKIISYFFFNSMYNRKITRDTIDFVEYISKVNRQEKYNIKFNLPFNSNEWEIFYTFARRRFLEIDNKESGILENVYILLLTQSHTKDNLYKICQLIRILEKNMIIRYPEKFNDIRIVKNDIQDDYRNTIEKLCEFLDSNRGVIKSDSIYNIKSILSKTKEELVH